MLHVLALCTFSAAQQPMMRPPEVPPFLEHVAPAPRAVGEKLPVEIEAMVRKALAGRILIGTSFDLGLPLDVVAVPEALMDAYTKHPSATIDYLLSIAEKAEPYDSMKAVAYAVSLAKRPAAGVIMVRMFDKAKYDELVPAWGATTRQHLISKVRRDISP